MFSKTVLFVLALLLAASTNAPAGQPGSRTLLGERVASATATDARIRGLEQKVERLEQLIELHDQNAEQPAGTLRVYWKDGIRMESADKAFKLKLGGRIQNDWAFFSADNDLEAAAGTFDDGTQFRRARLYLAGQIYDDVIFKAQYDFAGGDADFKDVYLGLTHLPYGTTVKVGHFKEPFGLEELTSSKYLTFLERSLPDTFAPSRNTGLAANGELAGERATWAAGLFRETNGFGDANGDAYNVTVRVTGLPWYESEGARLLHLGFAYSHKNPDNTVDFAERPEAHLAPKVVNSGSITADSVDLFGTEAALVYGPLSLQGEYMLASVDTTSGPSADLSGYYVYASYFLTGEHRAYKRSHGAFARLKPLRSFRASQGGGPGAWEIGLRYSTLDLNDGPVAGGELDDLTVGLNWYLNPNTRVMANYVRADLDSAGEADIFQMRFQVAF